MNIKIPARSVEVCDLCQRDGVLTTCIVCGSVYCFNCDGLISGCVVRPNLCRTCSDLPAVIGTVREYGTKLTPIVRKRDAALKRIGVALRRHKQNDVVRFSIKDGA